MRNCVGVVLLVVITEYEMTFCPHVRKQLTAQQAQLTARIHAYSIVYLMNRELVSLQVETVTLTRSGRAGTFAYKRSDVDTRSVNDRTRSSADAETTCATSLTVTLKKIHLISTHRTKRPNQRPWATFC